MRFAYRDVRDHSWLMAMSWRPASAATNCCKDVHAAPLRTRSLHFAILGLARRRDCTDSIRLYGRYEHHEAQRSDGERDETQNVIHISSYPFSISRRTGVATLLAMTRPPPERAARPRSPCDAPRERSALIQGQSERVSLGSRFDRSRFDQRAPSCTSLRECPATCGHSDG
jgi:hypothetical protein